MNRYRIVVALLYAALFALSSCSPGTGGQCTDECTDEGLTRCSGTVVQRCSNRGGCLAWEDVLDCQDQGRTCEEPMGYAVCVEKGSDDGTGDGGGNNSGSGDGTGCSTSCTIGEKRCSGTVVQVCTEVNGCPEWDDETDCASAGMMCSGGECMSQDGVIPPLGGTSGGSGGPTCTSPTPNTYQYCVFENQNLDGVTAYLVVPQNITDPVQLMIVFSGVEGAHNMAYNLAGYISAYVPGTRSFLYVVLDGRTATAEDGATVLDWARAHYNVDNDRTYLLSESAGTAQGLRLGFHLRQSYFAAYWANDVNTRDTPEKTASELGFAPWGNAGPGGDGPDAQAIVDGMRSAGYRLPSDAPYSGPGSDQHGSTDQFKAAMSFFPGKSRQ